MIEFGPSCPLLINQPSSETIAKEIIRTATYASLGALGACIASIYPIGGAIFGATFGTSQASLEKVLNEIFGNSSAEKVVKFVIAFFGSILVGKVVASLLGYSFTFISGLYLFAAMTVAGFILPTLIPLHQLDLAEFENSCRHVKFRWNA